MDLENNLANFYYSIRNFTIKLKDAPSQALKYLASYGGATIASYIIGAGSAYYSRDRGCSPELIAALSFAAKTSAFYVSNAGIYTSLYWDEYRKGRLWRKDMDNIIISSAGGTGVTLIGGGIHWGLMRAVNMSPIFSFIIGNLIPGESAVAVKLVRDAKNGIIVKSK